MFDISRVQSHIVSTIVNRQQYPPMLLSGGRGPSAERDGRRCEVLEPSLGCLATSIHLLRAAPLVPPQSLHAASHSLFYWSPTPLSGGELGPETRGGV